MAEDAFDKELEERDRALREAETPSPYATPLGASNAPFDCKIFSGDYRERLPEGDPARLLGGDIRVHGSDAAGDAMRAAHEAGLSAARQHSF